MYVKSLVWFKEQAFGIFQRVWYFAFSTSSSLSGKSFYCIFLELYNILLSFRLNKYFFIRLHQSRGIRDRSSPPSLASTGLHEKFFNLTVSNVKVQLQREYKVYQKPAIWHCLYFVHRRWFLWFACLQSENIVDKKAEFT